MILGLVVAFLGAALLLYVVLGGADFGAGILEIAIRDERQERRLADAIAPVWEANHVWLILVVVILFVGFPPAYAVVSHYLHIPLLAALVGIVFRGATFAFRHYDVRGEEGEGWFGPVFRAASLLTPFFLGVTLGGAILGRLDPEAETFLAAFVRPWLHPFPFALGAFTVALCAYAAAVFMVGEVEEPAARRRFVRAARRGLLAAVGTGALVFLTAELGGRPLVREYLAAPLATGSVVAATALLLLVARAVERGRVWASRIFLGVQLGAILFGWFAAEYPVLVRLEGGAVLTVHDAQAPPATLAALALALVVGGAVVLPAFGYLFWVFKLR